MSNLLTERWLKLVFAEDSTTVQLDEAKKKNKNSKVYDDCWDGYRKVPGKERGEKGSCELDDHDEKMDEVEEIQEISRQVKRVIQEKKKKKPVKGMWDRIADKKAEGKPPNKPGDPGYPSEKAWKENTSENDEHHMGDELNEVDEYDEGNAFSGARQAAIDAGEDEFEVDGKKYKVTGEITPTNEAALRSLIRDMILEACYDGRKVTLNKPSSNSENPKKKSKVYVAGKGKYKSGACKGQTKAKKVQFGDPNMRIRKSNPKARSNFRKRHKCHEKKPKDSAGYWSCKAW